MKWKQNKAQCNQIEREKTRIQKENQRRFRDCVRFACIDSFSVGGFVIFAFQHCSTKLGKEKREISLKWIEWT